MQTRDANTRFDLSPAIRIGLIGGIITLLMCLIGIVEVSIVRAVIYPFLSLGQTLLLLAYLLFCSMAVRRMLAIFRKSTPALVGGRQRSPGRFVDQRIPCRFGAHRQLDQPAVRALSGPHPSSMIY